MSSAAFTIDHLFVCATRAEAGALIESGFAPGRAAVHEGQGTANLCFCFDNAYLECLWMHDEAEIRSAAVSPVSLWERTHWRENGACPFGVALRRKSPSAQPHTWAYAAPFLPPGATLPILTPPDSPELPLVFLSPLAPGDRSHCPPAEHGGMRREIARVRIEMPQAELPPVLRAIEASPPVGFARGPDYRMQIDFVPDTGGPIDFRPRLPLCVRR